MSERNLQITGSGNIIEGEYGFVKIMGDATAQGLVKAREITIMGNGTFHGDIEASKIVIHGNASFMKQVKTEFMKVNGNLTVDLDAIALDLTVNGNCSIEKDLECGNVLVRGNYDSKGSVKGKEIKILGNLSCPGNITAENIEVRGVIWCDGLMNAEKITVYSYGKSYCKEIGASEVNILKPKFLSAMFSFPKNKYFESELVEGDVVRGQQLFVKEIHAQKVYLSKKCHVNRVEYTDTLEVESSCVVEESVKIGEL